MDRPRPFPLGAHKREASGVIIGTNYSPKDKLERMREGARMNTRLLFSFFLFFVRVARMPGRSHFRYHTAVLFGSVLPWMELRGFPLSQGFFYVY